MDANTSSTVEPTSEPARAAGLARLVNAIDQLAAEDPAALPDPLAAEEVLALRRQLDPHALRRAAEHLRYAADPDGEDQRARARFERRGLQVAPTWQGLTAVKGLLDPEAGETLLAALQPLARPAGPGDPRSAPQRRADALAELCRRQLEGGRLPAAGGGVRPQVTVSIDLASLLGTSGMPGTFGWGATASPATTR